MSSRLDRLSKIILLLGFVGISAAIFSASLNPVTGYELSIYTETPISFWVFCSFALLSAILIIFSDVTRRVRMVGVFLGGLSMTTIVALPIIRGYHYLGEADSLSHLGTAMDMIAGIRPLTESRYPIVHILGSVLHAVTGLELRHAMLLLVVTFVVCFFVFVPLVVRELTASEWTVYVGFFSGLLLLPINHLSPSLYIHPTSQAIMFAPAFLFVFLVLYSQRIARHTVMFLLVATMFVLLHPQQAANFVLFFGAIATIQMGSDIVRRHWRNRRREWVIPEVTLYAAAFLFWVKDLPVFWRNFERVYMIPFEETQAARSTATRSVSLTQVGGSLPEVFMKLFFVQLIFALLTGLLMVLIVGRAVGLGSHTTHDTTLPDGGSEQKLPLYIFVGLGAVTMIFLAYFIGGVSDQYFRHLGMLMVFGTILGAIAIGESMRYIRRHWSDTSARRSIALVLILCTVLTIPVVFNSPYIYYSSNHVTKAQMDGYATTFEHQSDSMVFDDIRSRVYRYGHATQGTNQEEDVFYQEDREGIPNHFVNRSLRRYYNESVYIPVTEADRTRDPILWKGFRFSDEDFDYLDTEPGIDRVQTNGGYDLYIVNPVGEPSNGTRADPSIDPP